MSVCNGVNTKKFSRKRTQPSRLGESKTHIEEKDIAFEIFRGFEKKPVVVVPRYDITPFLNKSRKTINTRNLRTNNTVVQAKNVASLIKFVKDCSVRVASHDLRKLQGSLSIQSPRSDISESNADEEMGHLRCKICEKVYSSEKKLQNHQQNKHMIVYRPEKKPQKKVSFSDHVIIHEVKEYHKCRKCPRIFEDYKSLKSHMKEFHKKRKCYICNYCNKKFVDRMFFKVHIRLHCDVCGVLLKNKSKFQEHRRSVCRVLKMHLCKTCNCSFFRFMDLKDHSYEHLSTFFICDICKDQFATKCAVAHHISFLHCKRRPTLMYDMRNLGSERLYLCNFCDESSVDRDLIEAHVQALPDLSNRAMTDAGKRKGKRKN
ncbi:zinc finger protein 808-like isoform X3 [Plodia interpunctella]|uniref:zinc finger protein 808-like isoform X3 n=1 Tax=Plodia interpunctella TaxID=58824 RepID=UPI002367F9E3|nr:zinc finger protein 808-like isoform X3 [Plodia interpunctella]